MQTSCRKMLSVLQRRVLPSSLNSSRQTILGRRQSITCQVAMPVMPAPSPYSTTRTMAICSNPVNQLNRLRSRALDMPKDNLVRTLPQLFSTCRNCLCEKTTKEVSQSTTTRPAMDEKITRVASSEHHQHFSARHATDFDKKLLVYFGKYKTVEEVPLLVSVHLLNSTRNRFRVYVNIFIGLLTMTGCSIMIYRGHTRAGHGETLADHNMKRHPEHYQKQLKG